MDSVIISQYSKVRLVSPEGVGHHGWSSLISARKTRLWKADPGVARLADPLTTLSSPFSALKMGRQLFDFGILLTGRVGARLWVPEKVSCVL